VRITSESTNRGRRGRSVAAFVLTAFVGLITMSPSAAFADAGVGIDPGEITGLSPVAVDTVTTVAVVVRNPGSESASYRMLAQPLNGEPQLPIEPTWFTFEPATFDIAGGAAQEVQVAFSVPEGTAAGDYLALVTAQLVLGEPETSGAQVGAAVATKLFITVPELAESSSRSPVWPVVGGIAAAIAIAALVGWRKSGIKLSVSRAR
jgi:hypothetical protein